MKYLIKKPDTFLRMLNDDISSILHKSFDGMFPEYVLEQETDGMIMPAEITEFDDKYRVKVELPGIRKEDINLEITKNSMKIEASKTEEMKDGEEKNKKCHRCEFRYGNYSRTFYFPEDTDTNSAKAELHDGVLKITLFKKEKEDKDKIKVEIE